MFIIFFQLAISNHDILLEVVKLMSICYIMINIKPQKNRFHVMVDFMGQLD